MAGLHTFTSHLPSRFTLTATSAVLAFKAIDLSFRKGRSWLKSIVPDFVCTFYDDRHPISAVLKLSPYHEPAQGR